MMLPLRRISPFIIYTWLFCLPSLAQTQPTHPVPVKRILLDRLEASVNASPILKADLQKFRETVKLRAQLDPLFNGTPIAKHQDHLTNQEIIDFLINELLITQKFPKTDSEVEQEINSIQTTNHLSRTELKDALQREKFKFTDYFHLIRGASSKRDMIDREIRPKIAISESDLKNYFYNNMSRDETKSRTYHIEIISIAIENYKSPSGAYSVAQTALANLANGEAFEDVAHRVSDHPSKNSGGDLGLLTEDQMSPLMRAQLKKLQIGKVSSIFGGPDQRVAHAKPGKNTGNYYILKLKNIQSNEDNRFETLKEDIRSRLAATEYQHQIDLWLERQRQSSSIHLAGESALKAIPLLNR